MRDVALELSKAKKLSIYNKKQHIFVLLFFAIFLCATNANASPYSFLNQTQKDYWNRLNHYNDSGVSIIDNKDFFLIKDGYKNPEAEFNYYYALIRENNTTRTHTKTICQFPARYIFFKTQIFKNDISLIKDCEAFQKAVKPSEIKSISLLFASGYFDNPSSYYGHVLLRFNYDDSHSKFTNIDSSLNYGADLEDVNPNSFIHIYKGLTGGYTGSYQQNNDFLYSYRYTNAELRDLWEYELNLTKEQINLLSAHSWEMQRAHFKYYYFNDNCAHKVAELIDFVTGSNLLDSHGFWLIPTQVITNLKASQNKNAALVSKQVYHPSLRTKLINTYNSLPKSDKQKIKNYFKYFEDQQNINLSDYGSTNLLIILDHLDIANAQFTLSGNQDNKRKVEIDQARQSILMALLERPANDSRFKEDLIAVNNNTPGLRASSSLNIGYKYYSNNPDKTILGYRIANNDLLNAPIYGQDTSQLIMGQFQLAIDNNDIDIVDVTAVDIINLNPNILPIPYAQGHSWRIRLGYGNRDTVCTDCATLHALGQIGHTTYINDDILAYALTGASLHHKKSENHDHIGWDSTAGAIIHVNDSIRANIYADYQINPFNMSEQNFVANSDFVYDLNFKNDIRFETGADFKGNISSSIRLNHYFN